MVGKILRRGANLARSKNGYIINVHYPSNELALFELRKRMGNAYIKFIQDYIKTLPIDDDQKNKLYLSVIEKLQIDKSASENLNKAVNTNV